MKIIKSLAISAVLGAVVVVWKIRHQLNRDVPPYPVKPSANNTASSTPLNKTSAEEMLTKKTSAEPEAASAPLIKETQPLQEEPTLFVGEKGFIPLSKEWRDFLLSQAEKADRDSEHTFVLQGSSYGLGTRGDVDKASGTVTFNGRDIQKLLAKAQHVLN